LTEDRLSKSRPFRLVRHFSLTSLVAIVIVASALAAYYAAQAESALLAQGEQKNAAQLLLILNQVSEAERATLDGLMARTTGPARNDPLVREMHATFLRSVAGTSIVKLKLYNKQGLTVFSSEPAQIGENKSTYAGFIAALAGTPASQLSHRESFEAFGGKLREIDVIGSYLPVRGGDNRIVGVIEIYDDVTRLAATIGTTRWHVAALCALMMTGLYLALLIIVSRAARVLRNHETALQREIRERTQVAAEAQRAQKATERAQKETEIAYAMALDARRAAVAADQAKSEFLVQLSEEMRTPLNGIVGLSEVVLNEHLTRVQYENLTQVRQCSLSLLGLLEDRVAGLADDAAPAAPALWQAFSPALVAREALGLYVPLAREKGLRLEGYTAPGLPDPILGDGPHLRQVLRDLVGAAVRYLASGTISIRIENLSQGEDLRLRYAVHVESESLFDGMHCPWGKGLNQDTPAADLPQWRGAFFDVKLVSRRVERLGGVLMLKTDGMRTLAIRLTMPHRAMPVVPEAADDAQLPVAVEPVEVTVHTRGGADETEWQDTQLAAA
jgi:signal transduction histidine kinase